MAIFTAIASFIGTAIVGAIGLTGATIAGVSLATIVGSLVVGAALLGLSALLTPKPPRFNNQALAQQYQAVVNQAAAPRRRGYGREKGGGIRAFYDSNGGVLHQIVMMHSGEIDAFEELYLGDKLVTLSGPSVTTSPFSPYVNLYPATGAASQAALASIVSAFPSVWTADHKLNGIAYVGASFSSPPSEEYLKVFPEGAATPTRAVMRLSRVFDPRTGVTAWSENAALCIRDFLLHPDGYRLTIDDIDEASFIAFANLCDEAVPLAAGGTQPRYTLGGMYNLNDEPKQVLVRMLAACDGELLENKDGKLEIRGGKWDEPTVTIGPENIREADLQQGADAFGAFNKLRILFTDPTQDYQATEAKAWDNLADQAERGVMEENFSVDMVRSAPQARRLAKIFRAKNNPEWRGTIATDLVGLNARGERTIRVVFPALQIDGTFFVTSHGIAADLSGCTIGISSLSSDAYDWNAAAEEGQNPIPPGDTRPDLTLPIPTGLLPVVVSRQITSATVAPVVVATVNTPARTEIQLEAQIRLNSLAIWEAMSVASGQFEALSGVLVDGATYQVRARFRTGGAAGDWTAEEEIVITANPTAPDAPTGFSATLNGDDVDLAWTNPATNFFRSRVFRSATDSFGGATAIAVVSGLSGQPSTFTDPDPGVGTWYYWVVALNESNVASAPAGSEEITII
jgi:hypothetical protein